jgi:PAS domain S-box-containing protein
MSLRFWTRWTPHIVSLIVFCISCLVLFGWCFNITLLKSGLWNDVATVKVNTALCFAIASGTLALIIRHANPLKLGQATTQPILSGILSILLISGLTLLEYGSGWNLKIDQFLFSDQISLATPHPGRMGINTAVKFMLLGIALWLFNHRRPASIKIAQLITLATAAIALQAVVGYSYGVRIFYQPSGHITAIALPTALMFLILCIGMLFLYPDRGFMQSFTTELDGGVIARKLLPAAILLPFFLGWCLVWGYRAGYYEPEFGFSLLVVSLVAIQTALIWQSVELLNRNDAKRRRLEVTRQQAEADLRESETRFRQITESIDDVFWMTDAQTQQIIYISPQYEKIWQRPLQNLKQKWSDWIESIHPDDRSRVQKSFFPNVLQRQYSEEYRILLPDGRIRWVRDRGYPVHDATGAVQYISGIAEDITERKQLQSEHDNFFRLSLDLLCVADMDGYFRQLNPAFERVLGYSKTDLIAQPFIEFVHPDDRTSTLAALKQLSQGEPVLHFENRYRCKDGSYRWLDWVTKPIVEEGLLYAVAHDVTSRKQLEAELRLNQERFKCLYEADIIGIVVADFTGDIVEANDAFLKIVGYSRTDLQNQAVSWLDMTPPEWLPFDQASIQQVQQTGSGPIYEKEFIRKDGSRVSVLLGAALLSEAPETAICFILDLTARKRTESALRESEARFRYMTDVAPMLVWMSGVDQQCNYFNQAWLNFTGRTIEQELGFGWAEGVHPDDYQRCVGIYTTAFDARQPFEMEYQLRRADGSYRWILDIGVPRFTPTGDFLGYLGSCFDIHDRKQAEADTRRINELLELRVQERTRQLEMANKELESFSYSVSHDLRAPLRHIAGFVELLQKRLDPSALDATSQRYLSIIAETTRQAGTLIDDLLAFSHMGRSEMRSMQVDLQQMVQEIQQELEPEIAQRQIQWQIDPLPIVQGDPSMLRLVVRNLVENAVKYTRLRTQTEIHIGSISNEQEDVVFVRDNGIGFNMQYAHKLFGIFQRLHSDPNYEGTGIGLANVRRIVHRHGGRTWAESTLNQGSTFYFSLPKQVVEQPMGPLLD